MMYQKYFKRIFDLIFAFIVLVLISPLLLISAILIKLTSKGPVFFLQERLGKDEKPFNIIKFRTMTNVERKIHQPIFKDNPEVTKIGKILRRFKIDEMPQVINVLKGDMGVVGPRPCLTQIRNKFDSNTPYRFLVRPGLTSNAAVNGSIYLTWPEKWEYDKQYALNVSFLYDAQIIFKTIFVVILGEEKFLNKPQSK